MAVAVAVVLAGVAALLTAFWIFFSRHFNYWKDRGVVSCNPFSLTGDRSGALALSGSVHELLTPIYRKYKGKHRFVGTFQARTPVLVVMDPDLVKEVLIRDFSNFHGRGLPVNEKADPLSANLFALAGPRWKYLRMKMSTIFSSGKLKLMFPLMADTTEDLLGVVKAAADKDDGEVDLAEKLMQYSTDVIGSVAFGIECKTLAGEGAEFQTMAHEISQRGVLLLIRILLTSFHPIFLRLIPFKKMFSRTSDFFLRLMTDQVTYREEHKVERNDFVQMMMQLRDEDRARPPADRLNHIQINPESMTAQAFPFFLAGLDNVAYTVGFALHELALNQELQERALADVVGAVAKHEGALSYDALRDMHLIHAIIREALRKYTPVPFVFRKPQQPFKVPDSDVVIDPTASVLVPVYQMMNDPAHFPSPERFDPDRFTDEAKQQRHAMAYLPFGEGPRFCVAERFAMLEMKLCLAAVLRRFHLAASSPVELDHKSSTLKPKGGIRLRVQERSSSP